MVVLDHGRQSILQCNRVGDTESVVYIHAPNNVLRPSLSALPLSLVFTGCLHAACSLSPKPCPISMVARLRAIVVAPVLSILSFFLILLAKVEWSRWRFSLLGIYVVAIITTFSLFLALESESASYHAGQWLLEISWLICFSGQVGSHTMK